MGYLLEGLGRGLLGNLGSAFEAQLGDTSDEPTWALVEAVHDRPEDIEAHMALGRRHLKEGRFAAAQANFDHVLQLDRRATAARLGLICAMDEMGRTDEAIRHLQIAQKEDPTNSAILFSLGLCHERRNQLDVAAQYYRDALNFCPQLRNAHERLAAICLHDGRPTDAIPHYELLCRWDPDSVDARLILAGLFLETGQPQLAIEHYERALVMEPDNWVAHNDLASAYEQAGLIHEAIEHLHETAETRPGFADTHLRLGDLYARLGDDPAALRHYAQALEIHPEYLEAVVKMGTQHLRNGRYLEAARWFNRAVEINDRLLVAYVGLGLAQRAAGRTEEAMAAFDMAASVEPNSTLLFSEMARLQLKVAAHQSTEGVLNPHPRRSPASGGAEGVTDLIDQQIKRHRQALKTRPNHADMHYRLGLLLRNRGLNDQAIEEFRCAVEINPVYVKALIKLGLALKEAGELDEAISVLERAVELKPEYVDLHYHLGLLFAERNRFELAIEHFEQAIKGAPDNVDFHANLALALQNMGLLDRAAATWQAVCELTPAESAGPTQTA